MAKEPPGKKQENGKAGARRVRGKTYTVTAPLRFLLHQMEIRLGLFPPDTGFDGYGRFHAPVLVAANEPVPAGMRSVFGEELGALARIGKGTEGCRAFDLPPLKLYCLPYYYFDGFNAIVYAERGGKMFAAWKEQEMHAEGSPQTIAAPGPFEEFQGVFREALSLPD